MKTLELKGELREVEGKKGASALRREKMVPCVIYGGETPVHFSVEVSELKPLVYTPNAYFVNINLQDKTYKSAMREIQTHPVTDALLHIDFVQVFDDKPVKMELPVRVVGNSAGVRAGGKLSVNVRKLKVEALPGKMPDDISLDITNLNIGDKLRISDLNVEGVTFLDASNVVVATVRMTRSAKSAAAAEEAKK